MKTYTHKIGTNSKENWEIIDNADSFDLWFHINAFPSGHVIVKEQLKNNIISEEPIYPNQIITLAANYCKMQSKLKDKNKLKIVYTHVKNLKKGKEIGSVIVSNEKFIFI
jgi:predicted ribosome quality control (RQC) complex YloA/Tae2 family protein